VARFGAVAAAGETIARYLQTQFAGFSLAPSLRVRQVTTSSFAPSATLPIDAKGTLTLLLYRVDLGAPGPRTNVGWTQPAAAPPEMRYLIPLDLKFLLTPWADDAIVQQAILGRALTALAGHTTFAASDLVTSVGGGVDQIWDPGESFQFVPDELGTEDLYQIWESLGRTFELSIPFKVRGIRLQADSFEGADTVVERNLDVGRAASIT
jgi:hypothetical protein